MKKFYWLLLLLPALNNVSSQDFIHAADSIRKYRTISALTYAVFTGDKILDIGVTGVRKFRSRDSVKLTHRFQIGTTTSLFTSYVAARLVESGKISWNTRILDVFPELNGKVMKVYNKITLFQLLSHRAGIRPYTEITDYREIHALPGTPVQQRKSFTTMVLKQRPLLVLDSTKMVYSVAGTVIAAAMMEKITGKPWEELIVQYVNRPLNINVGFGFPNAKDSLQPIGHWDNYGAMTEEPNNYWAQSFTSIAPAGNINLSIVEYVKFLQDILKALAKNKSLVTPRSANYMLFDFPNDGLGWKNFEWNNFHIASWVGKGAVYSSYVEIIKEKNIGIVVMCNSGTSNGRGGVMNLGRILREYYATSNTQ